MSKNIKHSPKNKYRTVLWNVRICLTYACVRFRTFFRLSEGAVHHGFALLSRWVWNFLAMEVPRLWFSCYFRAVTCLWRCCLSPQACPVWGDWTEWSQCSALCGGGYTLRTRSCLNGRSGHAGCEGGDRQETPCNTRVRWMEWLLLDGGNCKVLLIILISDVRRH